MNSVEKSLNENKHALHSLVVFRRAANTISKKEMETIRKYGVTVAQFGVLEALYNKGDLRIQDLIDKLLSTSGNMTVVIKNMIREGYISKTIDCKDRRAFRIGLTPYGRETIEKILPDHYAHVGELFSVLSQEEQVQLAEILKKFKN